MDFTEPLHNNLVGTMYHRDQSVSKQALVFTCLQYTSFENTVGKGEFAHYEQNFDNFAPFLRIRNCCLQILSNSKICRLGKGYDSLPNDKIF